MIEQLRQRLQALQNPPGSTDGPGALPLGIAASTRRSAAASRAARCTRSRRRARPISPRRRGSRWGWPRADGPPLLDRRGHGARRKRRALRPRPRCLRPCARAAADGCRRAAARSAVGDGGSAALPRRWRRDRRMAPRRDRHGGAAAAVARRGGKRRAGAAAARRAADDASTAATRWIVGAAPSAATAHGPRAAAALPRISSATAAARSAHGFSNGVTAMSASCSQRLLSLWLRRLSTDRIARSRESRVRFLRRSSSTASAAMPN